MKKVIMVILDGFGINDNDYGNAIRQTSMECYNEIYSENHDGKDGTYPSLLYCL